MDAVEFLKARRRLCNNNICEDSCPLFHGQKNIPSKQCRINYSMFSQIKNNKWLCTFMPYEH